MLLEQPLFIIPLSTGLIFMVAALVMMIFPPKKINHLYGYRTKRSMKSQERWDFAQIYSAKEMLKIGFILACLCVLGVLIDLGESLNTTLGLSLIILAAIILIYRVEQALKSKFED